MRGVHFWRAESLRCEPLGGETVYAQVDGEPLGRLPVEFHIVPEALTLIVPEAYSGQQSLIRNHRQSEHREVMAT